MSVAQTWQREMWQGLALSIGTLRVTEGAAELYETAAERTASKGAPLCVDRGRSQGGSRRVEADEGQSLFYESPPKR